MSKYFTDQVLDQYVSNCLGERDAISNTLHLLIKELLLPETCRILSDLASIH